MKYVMAEARMQGALETQKMPVVFPNNLVHGLVGQLFIELLAKHGYVDVKLVSAGCCVHRAQ
jgi:hypothetical protein